MSATHNAPLGASGPAILCAGLRFRYPGGELMHWPDWQAQAGDVVLLHGPSGSGKSTLLALCAGLLQASEGELTLAGQRVADLAPGARDRWRGRHLGVLPQRLALSHALTVYQNLQLAGLAAGQALEADWLLRLCQVLGIDDLLARRPQTLSVGQAQRVALARALALRPSIILADEPTASLDAEAARAVLSVLVQAVGLAQATLVIATHDERVARHLRAAGCAASVVDLGGPGAGLGDGGLRQSGGAGSLGRSTA